MTTTQDPIAHASRLLREAAEELRQAHAFPGIEGWENETDAKAAYDEHMAAARAPADSVAAPAIGDELRDTLVAVSAAIAERDDRAAQKMIREILAATPTPPAEKPIGEVVVTKTRDGQIVSVTRQDDEGRILSVIATSDPEEQSQPRYSHLHDADAVHGKQLSVYSKPPAEQKAPKETLGGVNGWRDISTAPKDGSRFVATGHNYGLYSEGRHICVAQWFRGCWMEASDWNEASELKYLTHWMPLPSPPDDVAAPAEQQAAPKAAPGKPSDAEIDEFIDLHCWDANGRRSIVRHAIARWGAAPTTRPAPQQEAQEPVAVPRFNCWSTNEGDSWFDHPADSQAIYDCLGDDAKVGDEYELTAGWKSVTARYRITEVVGDGEEYEVECISHPQANTAPQPAPAPLSEREAFESTWENLYGNKPVLLDTAFKEAKMDVPAHSAGKYFHRDAQAAWKAWQGRAALAAQGGK